MPIPSEIIFKYKIESYIKMVHSAYSNNQSNYFTDVIVMKQKLVDIYVLHIPHHFTEHTDYFQPLRIHVICACVHVSVCEW